MPSSAPDTTATPANPHAPRDLHHTFLLELDTCAKIAYSAPGSSPPPGIYHRSKIDHWRDICAECGQLHRYRDWLGRHSLEPYVFKPYPTPPGSIMRGFPSAVRKGVRFSADLGTPEAPTPEPLTSGESSPEAEPEPEAETGAGLGFGSSSGRQALGVMSEEDVNVRDGRSTPGISIRLNL